MSANKWLSLLSGLFLGFGVVGMILFDDENEPGGRLPAYISFAIGAPLLVATFIVKEPTKKG
ncbi:MAG: hypothetical protein ACR2HJ_09370 [Fimbriimonadales bacterium]